MRALIVLFSLVLSISTFAQNDRYTAAMEKAVGELQAAEQTRDFSAPANTFERITAAAPEGEWLPAYYQSYCHIMQAVGAMQQGKPDQITAFLEKAQSALDKAKEISPENPEILALQGYIYTGHIWADPMGNGPMYSPQSVAAYQTAIEAGPDHPRAYHLMGMHLFYMPAMYGGGPARALPYLEKAGERFESYEPASPMHPAWGSYFNQQLLEQATAKLEKEEK
ncbi:hypothetical protein [Phaeodactylibacter xiamenensis]|uniref:hypothetical protein n=1 Tax=Phaeodactylibacter xiamenensis TaxID=1524460 RepID=UPI0024A90B77|nr:hypothetical protein [Phaeodactylibacter xiamenensis]